MPSVKVLTVIAIIMAVVSVSFVQYMASRRPMEPKVEMEVRGMPMKVQEKENYTYTIEARATISGEYKVYVFNGFCEGVESEEYPKIYEINLDNKWTTKNFTLNVPVEHFPVGQTVRIEIRDKNGKKNLAYKEFDISF